MKRGRRAKLAAAILACLAAGCGGDPDTAAGEDVLIFAAASLRTALDEIAPPCGLTAGARILTSYAATSALARQIESGAPAQIFISADVQWMDYVADRDLILRESRVDLLGNTLVLVAPVSRPPEWPIDIAPGFPLAAALGDGRLAVADPTAVPAGRYAKAALESLGVWSSVADRLAPAEDVRAALRLVSRAEAPLGIVYGTDAKAEAGVAVVGWFPPDSHPPIVYPAALTQGAGPAATRVLQCLKGTAARTVFERWGFTTPAGGTR
jgi:molybdate transport system substrate-binding protein